MIKHCTAKSNWEKREPTRWMHCKILWPFGIPPDTHDIKCLRSSVPLISFCVHFCLCGFGLETWGFDNDFFFNCTVFSWGMWKLCSHNSVANSDGVERLLWDFQMNITAEVSCKKKQKTNLINRISVCSLATVPETSNTGWKNNQIIS